MKRNFKKILAAMLAIMATATQAREFEQLTLNDITHLPEYNDSIGYGFDLGTSWDGKKADPFFISVRVPDGNYRVTMTLGSRKKAASTTVRAECRRLFIENLETRKGETVTRSFLVNKREPGFIDPKGNSARVAIKDREKGLLHWDNRLTIEINGDAPQIQCISIERDTVCPTLYLIGNSTVTDQPLEPWASWGQMVTRWLSDSIAVANYAESGLSAQTFIAQRRLDKIVSQLKPGDFVMTEFGHNDQKMDSYIGFGAYYAFSHNIKIIIDNARLKGATPLLCTPTMRRMFEGDRIKNTHTDYPEAIRDIAAREKITLIDLQKMTGIFYEAMGPENSKQAFVHYPAGTWPGQTAALADNTHFNPYGAYEIAKMVLQELNDDEKKNTLRRFITADFKGFDPAHPDSREDFHWCNCPLSEVAKPDGN